MLNTQQIGGAVGFAPWTGENLPLDKKALSRVGTNALYVAIDDADIDPTSQSVGRLYVATDGGVGTVPGGYLTIRYDVTFEVPQNHVPAENGYFRLHSSWPGTGIQLFVDTGRVPSALSNLAARGVTWGTSTITFPEELTGTYQMLLYATSETTLKLAKPTVAGGVFLNPSFRGNRDTIETSVESGNGTFSSLSGVFLLCMLVLDGTGGTVTLPPVDLTTAAGDANAYVLISEIPGPEVTLYQGLDQRNPEKSARLGDRKEAECRVEAPGGMTQVPEGFTLVRSQK